MSPFRPEMPEDVVRHPRKCRVCGCTDDRACPEGCYWVEADLCSECVDKRGRAKRPRKRK